MQISHRRTALIRTDRARRDGGYILAKFALLLVPLLLMTGLSVDVGSWYNRIADIQKAADAAALAGVVWLPDEGAAEERALAAARQNGFVHGEDDVEVRVQRAGDRRLRVTISDGKVESFFWSNLGGRDVAIERSGLAEYVLPVPLGSPRNYFGTGTLLGQPEYLYQAVNATCTSKVQGDRHQALHHADSCSRTPTNPDYRERGYELYIEAQEDRPASIEVLLFDPQYTNRTVTRPVPGPDSCSTTMNYGSWVEPTSSTTSIVVTGPAQYQLRTKRSNGSYNSFGSTQTLARGSSVVSNNDLIRYRVAATWNPSAVGWTGPHTSSSTTQVTATGPAVYQLRDNVNDTTYDSPVWLDDGETRTIRRDRIRYRRLTSINSTTTCTPTTVQKSEGPVDNRLGTGGASEDEDFTFSLYSADNTPLDDSDNPLVPGCSKVYEPDTAFERTFLDNQRWNVLCTITTTMPDGRYILRVENEGTDYTDAVDGVNSYGVVARYTDATGDGLCDGRVDAMCPRVYGRDAISVYAASQGSTAQFFLAEIEPEHTGKTLELELWDPGEGGESIKFLRPTGTDSWEAVEVDWASYNDHTGNRELNGSGTSVSLRSGETDLFNGKLLRIQIPLDDYSPPADNRWWKIEYKFAGTRPVTDRTTWSARVIGDPVHLLEEEAD